MLPVLFLFAACVQADQHRNAVNDTISVKGWGEVTAEPDKATVSVSVTALNKDVNKAKAEADRKYRAVIAAAKAQRIDKTDIKTAGLTLRPEYQWRDNTQILIGTKVMRSISITVNDIGSVAQLLQSLVEGDVSTINNVSTGFKDRRSLERKALTAAIDDAKEKAEFLAQQFGKNLGSAFTISEQSHAQTTPRQFGRAEMMVKSAQAALPDEHFGTQSVTASINVVFHSN